LNSLKEEKHSLFQRLKTVLNEEDEKRGKYEDRIHSEPKILGHDEELKMIVEKEMAVHKMVQSRPKKTVSEIMNSNWMMLKPRSLLCNKS
jgi:hypothetical protein